MFYALNEYCIVLIFSFLIICIHDEILGKLHQNLQGSVLASSQELHWRLYFLGPFQNAHKGPIKCKQSMASLLMRYC